MRAGSLATVKESGKKGEQTAGPGMTVSRPSDREEVAARAFATQTAISPLSCTACGDGGPCPACAGAAASLTRGPAASLPRTPLSGASALIDNALSSAGSPLSTPLRSHFERRLGADLGSVRVHDDARADAAARSLRARAFTFGNRIGLSADAPRPNTAPGRLLLAHEVAHTVQPGAERVLRREQLPPGHPTLQTAAELIASYTSWGNLDEEGLGQRLFELAWMGSGHYAFVIEVMDALDWSDRDDVASVFARNARDENLDEMARS
ncbi:MAG TPA: DUF4157 domain-containing protein, partial [Accumulibacter sp.]|nr:DUF4157 domain-containing protein [Accumulibacter sp.]